MFCNNCGNTNEGTPTFCNFCGKPLNTGNRNNNTSKIIIVIVLALILCGTLIVFFLTNNMISKDDKDTTTTTSGTTEKLDTEKKEVPRLDLTNVSFKDEDGVERSKKVEFIKGFVSEDGRDAYIVLKNNNDFNIEYRVYINYYKVGVRIKSNQNTSYFVKANTISVADIMVRIDEYYDAVDITYKTYLPGDYYYDIPVKDGDIKYTTEKGENIIGTYKNNTTESIYGYAGCLYYKGNELVYATRGYLNEVKPGEEKDCTCYTSYLPKGLDYDSRKFTIYTLYYTKGE
ncbi:MAG: hypothetical protein K5666_03330 [Bacilli bacterium]|nr:hypothetical protein [Bacilli bacterium]